MAKLTSDNLLEIWEPVIPGVEGTIVIVGVNPDDKEILAQQLRNKELCTDVIHYNMNTFDQVFKPRGDKWSFKDNKVPEESKGLGVFKLNNKGEVVSTKVLGEFTGFENYLKMDGEKAEFDSGAIRYTKTGKGRYDLIPGDVISDIIGYAEDILAGKNMMAISKADIIEDAFRGAPDDRFAKTVINLIVYHYAPCDIVQNEIGMTAHEVTRISFVDGIAPMLRELAIHYENGAEKYGVDNWKKGIPVTGGDRGGSFMDSAMRHLTQYLIGLTDEPHQISCIWNCVCGLWTLRQEELKKKD